MQQEPWHDLPHTLQLSDWRRRVAALYDRVRREETPHAAWRMWRDGRDSLFRDHPQSPLHADAAAGFSGLPAYDYAPQWRLLTETAPLPGTDGFEMDLGSDGRLAATAFAKTNGLAGRLGRELTLYWLEGYGGGLFLPFRDATAGNGTYGGGRYLLDTVKGADLGLVEGRLVLDFNFAYHPSCCYSTRWTCPLAPAENRIEIRIEAGERLGP